MSRLAAGVLIGCVGCMAPGGPKPNIPPVFTAERMTASLAAARADQAAGRMSGVMATATVDYWMGLKAALHPLPINPAEAAKRIDHLPTAGVDPDLVREGRVVVEKMRVAGDSIRSISAFEILFHFPRTRFIEAEVLSRAAVEQCRVVDRMRPDLAARYGVEFPPLDLP